MTIYIDTEIGDDANDGLSRDRAKKTFACLSSSPPDTEFRLVHRLQSPITIPNPRTCYKLVGVGTKER